MQDFEVIEIVSFPSEGTTQTPPHDHGDFIFQSYAPLAMRYFRDIFDISVEGFLNSIAAEPLGKNFFGKFEFLEKFSEDIEIDQKKRCLMSKIEIEIFPKKSISIKTRKNQYAAQKSKFSRIT